MYLADPTNRVDIGDCEKLPTGRSFMQMRSKVFHISTAAFLIAALGYLYCFLFFWPFVPTEGNGIGDSLLYLAPGQRMFQGELIYRDVFEFVTPGTALVNFFAFKIFGLRPWIPDVLALLLGIALVWLGIAVSRKLMRPTLALLPSAIFLVSARVFLYDPTHHLYSVLATIAAIAVLLERRTLFRISAAGLLCGLGASFTQTRGLAVVTGFAVFLWWESRWKEEGWRGLARKELWLFASFISAFLAVNAYFIWEAGPSRFFWCTVVFVLKYYPKEADYNTFQAIMTEFPAFQSPHSSLYSIAHWLFLFFATPLIFVFFFARYLRESRRKPLDYWERPMLVGIVGLFMLLSIAPAPDSARIAISALPALILLIWLLDSPRKVCRVSVAVLALGTLLTAIYSVAASRPQPVGILATPHGKLAFTDPNLYQEDLWIQQHTRPSDYFYEPLSQDAYFYLDLRNPTPLSSIQNNGYTPPQQVAEVIRGLELHQPRYILWSPQALDTLSPHENPSDASLGPLRDYLHSHYKLVRLFANSDEAWENDTE
jgi:hypothetical protein